MKKLALYTTLFVLFGAMAGCDSFVGDVDQPIDSIDDTQLNSESQIEFVIKGVQSRFSTTYDRISLHAGGLSDELFFDQRVPNATFPTYAEIDEGVIEFANNSNDGVYNALGELRFFADNLLARAAEITFEDTDLQQEATFTGNLYGGIARYFYATYFGLDIDGGGGGIITEDPANPGPFIPAPEMYTQALAKLNAALGLADDYNARAINTLIARIQLIQGNTAEARTAALAGMQEGDAPFQSLHSVDNSNEWYVQAGVGRTQWVVDFRYEGYIANDPNEANRIQLQDITGSDGTVFKRQGRYIDRSTPIAFATWQENELMLAELDLASDPAGALARVNAVRASHGIDPLGALDQSTLIVEREKELFTMGLRLVDERRFDIWHLGPDTWQYFPITQNERNINTNI
ncbi:MAG: hypothetical protein R2834_10295 [Rhodothermales bacterium]